MRRHRDDIEMALAGEAPAIVPFTFYDGLYPPGFDPAPLQARGMAVCARRSVWTMHRPNVKVTEVREDGGIRLIYQTPVGTVTSFQKAAALAYTPVEHPIKKRDDYRVARFIIEDTRYEPAYEEFLAKIEKVGQMGKVIAHTCYEPLMDLQVSWIGQEGFCYEVMDNEDAVLELHEVLAANHQAMYDIVANSPADYVLYGGNLVPEMVGVERVRDLLCPTWNAFAERLHDTGKKIGVHLDANNRLILDIVRDSLLDFIEAFTPPPDCNVRVDEARAAWPGKTLWINFPSSVHLQPEAEIREMTFEILRQAGDRRGFLIGVTEDVPAAHLARSVTTILDAISEYAGTC